MSPTMNPTGILREAMKLPARNQKLMLQVILLTLAPFSLLVLLHYLVASPLLQKVEDTYESSSLDPKDLRSLVALEIPFLVALCIVSVFGTIITIHASAFTYVGKSLSLKELMLWIFSTWKKPAITWLYVSLLTIAYIVVSLFSIQLPTLILIGTTNATYACSWLVAILAALLYLYFAPVWTLGLPISVVEDDCHGLMALKKSGKLVEDDDDVLGPVIRISSMLVATVLFCLTNMFTFVVHTVFYFECKRSHGEKLDMELGPGYHSVPTIINAS
ncbi:hypothetical protein F0562_024262 [Nyssa sinensis]|uniref:Uncharacterized protein n=1 Tax=Nyssa sinensis TaxID=561372 RepID=A0A5J5BAG0_9ASTE|nr:hypothetical protein F0562_024262 [Nyssa sinensis]